MLQWESLFDEDGNEYWEAASVYTDDGSPIMWRLRQRLRSGRIEIYEDHDLELKGDPDRLWTLPYLGRAREAIEKENEQIKERELARKHLQEKGLPPVPHTRENGFYTDNRLKRLTSIVGLIHVENRKQLEKWGVQTRTAFEWLTYLMEEVGETAEAIQKHEYYEGSWEDVVQEAIQAATLALKIAEMFMMERERAE